MEDKRILNDEELELAMIWASADNSINYFGCGQYSSSK
jgi:hypothetical protein